MSQPLLVNFLFKSLSGWATEPKHAHRDRNFRLADVLGNRAEMCSQGSPYRQQTPSQMLSASSREKLLSYGPSLPAHTLF